VPGRVGARNYGSTMTTKSPRTAIVSILATIVFVAGACGADADPATEPPDEPPSTEAPTVTDAPAEEPPATTAVPAETTSTTTTTTTEPPPVGPEPLALDDVPALVAAWGDGTGDPLDLAQRIIAFPLAIPAPDGTTSYAISVDLFAGDQATPWQWDWSYEVLSNEPMPDIDIELDDIGPGAVALRERYDPIMADLGWRRTGTTGSDPSSGAGGPQSVNHVYQSDAETIMANGLIATPNPVFVWADEEQVFDGGVPGFQIDVPLEFEAGAIPIPLVQAIIDGAAAIDGATLTDVEIDSRDRPETSFDAQYGLRYLEISIEWELPADAVDAAKTTFSTDPGPALAPGGESFFDPGFFEAEAPIDSGDRWSQSVVFVDRYEGTVTIQTGSEGEPIVTLDLRLEPERGVLQAPADE
jgi:hypothetical protein